MRWLVLFSLLFLACPKRVAAPPRALTVRLLTETAVRETTQLTQTRADLEIDTRDFERIPRVVATGETALLTGNGMEARLFGDEAATTGFAVDNCILIEVISAEGKVLHRAVVGYVDGVIQGAERIDSLGRQAFAFEPGEINLTALLPERDPFRLRATVLDIGGVGRVSDVFVRIAPREGSADELRGP